MRSGVRHPAETGRASKVAGKIIALTLLCAKEKGCSVFIFIQREAGPVLVREFIEAASRPGGYPAEPMGTPRHFS
jgi:hypothetical protein